MPITFTTAPLLQPFTVWNATKEQLCIQPHCLIPTDCYIGDKSHKLPLTGNLEYKLLREASDSSYPSNSHRKQRLY